MKLIKYNFKNKKGEEILNFTHRYNEEVHRKSYKIKSDLRNGDINKYSSLSYNDSPNLKNSCNITSNINFNNTSTAMMENSSNLNTYSKNSSLLLNTHNKDKTFLYYNKIPITNESLNKSGKKASSIKSQKLIMFEKEHQQAIKIRKRILNYSNILDKNKQYQKILNLNSIKQQKARLINKKLNSTVYKIPLTYFKKIIKIKNTKSNHNETVFDYQNNLLSLMPKNISDTSLSSLKESFYELNQSCLKVKPIIIKKYVANLERKEEKIIKQIKINNDKAIETLKKYGFTITKREFPSISMKKMFNKTSSNDPVKNLLENRLLSFSSSNTSFRDS